MQVSLLYILISLLSGIGLIVLLTAKYKINAFFALVLASFVVGLSVHIPLDELINTIKDGFGNILKSLGLIIVLGTTLGVILEQTGSTAVMANFILKKIGEKRSPIAMTITGFIVGLPIFCDSGYIVLSGLNQSLAKRTGISVAVLAVSMATGLYSVHCLIPPHPGAAAAAGIIGVDFGQLIFTGIFVAIPCAVVGYFWATYAGRKNPIIVTEEISTKEITVQPSIIKAFLPVVVPILLIALKSFLPKATTHGLLAILFAIGDPVIALSIGVVLALTNYRSANTRFNSWLQEAAEKAGGILVIIGAGGAFGAVLAATKIGDHLGASFALNSLGIFFPFFLTSIIKTAQGSSTVAIITASSIVHPMLPALGLTNPHGPLLCVLAMGAGSMMISHANDAYFWVIAKFSGLDMRTMLRVYTVATILMAITALLAVYVLSIFL